MSLFTSLFGSPSPSMPQAEHYLTRVEIARLVSRTRIKSLSSNEEHIVEQSLEQRRGSDGKISLRQIDEVLRKLKNQYKISETDRKGLMKVFKEYFKKFT